MQIINTSRKAFLQLRGMGLLEVEEFWILALHSNKRLIGKECVFRGTVDACPVYPRDVFRSACRWNASSIIVAHNHPSNDHRPSDDDISLTMRLHQIGVILGIELLDHLIITKKHYWSFADRGLVCFTVQNSAEHR